MRPREKRCAPIAQHERKGRLDSPGAGDRSFNHPRQCLLHEDLNRPLPAPTATAIPDASRRDKTLYDPFRFELADGLIVESEHGTQHFLGAFAEHRRRKSNR